MSAENEPDFRDPHVGTVGQAENGQGAETPQTGGPFKATPAYELRRQIMDSRIPKNEREHWASREIERLGRELAAAQAAIQAERESVARLQRQCTALENAKKEAESAALSHDLTAIMIAEARDRARAESESLRETNGRLRAALEKCQFYGATGVLPASFDAIKSIATEALALTPDSVASEFAALQKSLAEFREIVVNEVPTAHGPCPVYAQSAGDIRVLIAALRAEVAKSDQSLKELIENSSEESRALHHEIQDLEFERDGLRIALEKVVKMAEWSADLTSTPSGRLVLNEARLKLATPPAAQPGAITDSQRLDWLEGTMKKELGGGTPERHVSCDVHMRMPIRQAIDEAREREAKIAALKAHKPGTKEVTP